MHKPTQQIALDESTMLVGQHAVLDSLGLVLFAVELEQHLEDELELAIVLNDEREMTRRNSAFSSVATLTDFILAQLSNTTAPLSHG
ncbi:MAG: hypothetical protein IT331_08945 [Anaerolineae bacterium]|nr:hypothetical protein [Anaerolineae bacterium]